MNSRQEKTKALEFELTLISGTTVATGITLACSVRRQSDGFWWDGAAFTDTTYTTNNMTELTGDDGLEARYVFTVPATNAEDIYQFRARHTFAGDSDATMFEVEVETYSEGKQVARDGMEALPGDTINLVALLQEGGIPLTGKSVSVSIQRQSDSRFWTGVIWLSAYGTLPMVEQSGNVAMEGRYKLPFVIPAAPGNETYTWAAKYVGPPAQYFQGLIRTADVNLHNIDGDRVAAQDFKAAVRVVTRGTAVAGALTTTTMTTNLTEEGPNHYRGRAMYWVDGPLKDQQTEITVYDAITKKLSYRQVTVPPLAGNKFVIV